MNASVHKTGQRHDVRANVATFPRVLFETLQRWNQRRDIAERLTFQCRDVESNVSTFLRCFLFHVVTLSPNFATFLRGIFSTSRRSRDHQPGNFYKNFLSVENSLHSALLLPKPAQSFPCYLFLAAATSEPRNTTTQIHQN